jgi:glutaredoxin
MSSPTGITMYTREGCGDCYVAKRVMSKHDLGYDEIDILDDDTARDEVMRINGGLRRVPTILFPSGKVVVEPSARELEVELQTEGIIR